MPSTRRFAGYIRQSRQRRNGDAVSPQQQREAIQRAARDLGEVTAWYEDIDVSGAKTSRPQFNAMLEAIREGTVHGAIVAKADRLSRAAIRDTYAMLDAIEEAGGQWHAADLPGLDKSTPMGEFILTQNFAAGRLMWRLAAQDIDDAKARAAAKGKWLNGQAPVGYQHGPDGNLEPGPDAELVTELFTRVACDGLDPTLDWIGRHKGEGADPTRRWTRAWLVRLVTRRVYLGTTEWRGIVREDAHPPLVDLATWTRAKRRAEGLELPTRAPRAQYPFSGLAVCADCGQHLSGTLAGGRYIGPDGKKGGKRPGATYVPGFRAYKAGCPHRTYAPADTLEARTRELLVWSAAEFGEEDPIERIGPPDTGDVERATRELESARLARQADLENLALPPDALAVRVAKHDERIRELEATLAEAADAADPSLAPPTSEVVAAMSDVELAELMRNVGLRLAVEPGRRPLEERSRLRHHHV